MTIISPSFCLKSLLIVLFKQLVLHLVKNIILVVNFFDPTVNYELFQLIKFIFHVWPVILHILILILTINCFSIKLSYSKLKLSSQDLIFMNEVVC